MYAETLPPFAAFLSPEHATALDDTRSLEALQRLAQTNGPCRPCGEPLWRYAGTGLCFSCIIGEADASQDSELGAWSE